MDEPTRGVAPKRRLRAHRKEAADNAVGMLEVSAGRWTLPAFTLDQWFLTRQVPGHRRGGFRAWIREYDDGKAVSRHLGDWDRLHAAFMADPV